MIKIRCPLVVEGRYDRIRLASLIDGVILETGGFRIFKDREMVAALRSLALDPGLIIMTDSDAAGFKIRNFLINILGPNAKLKQVYIPSVSGKETRKNAPSAEGLLGVEGLSQEILLQAFTQAGLCSEIVTQKANLTRADLFDAALTGAPDSASKRRILLEHLRLPKRLSTSVLLQMLNTLLTREEFNTIISDLFPSV